MKSKNVNTETEMVGMATIFKNKKLMETYISPKERGGGGGGGGITFSPKMMQMVQSTPQTTKSEN